MSTSVRDLGAEAWHLIGEGLAQRHEELLREGSPLVVLAAEAVKLTIALRSNRLDPALQAAWRETVGKLADADEKRAKA